MKKLKALQGLTWSGFVFPLWAHLSILFPTAQHLFENHTGFLSPQTSLAYSFLPCSLYLIATWLTPLPSSGLGSILTSIRFMLAILFHTVAERLKIRDLFSHNSGSQKTEINASSRVVPSWGLKYLKKKIQRIKYLKGFISHWSVSFEIPKANEVLPAANQSFQAKVFFRKIQPTT